MTREEFLKLKELKTFRGRIVSDSMSPIINIGDFVDVKIGEMDLKKFDIILIYQDARLICHTLWHINQSVEPKLFKTRNLRGVGDMPVSHDDYLGKVISHKLNLWQKIRLYFLKDL